MSSSEVERMYEEQRLEKVLGEIEHQLEKAQASTQRFLEHKLRARKSMWDDITLARPPREHDFEILVQANQYIRDIKIETITQQFYIDTTRRLKKMYESPYFGRIDFQENGSERIEQIYIGISNLMDEESGDYWIYDWRAPVSSMFYDYEIGKASYQCPEFDLVGEISLKRQYRIAHKKLQYMFDSSLKIDDDILQEILARSADTRMRTIITSIQREQNRIIRDDNHRLLIVQGPAGSGKTSIALHRVAYLLYKYRDLVKAENIAIFSPNQIFNDYISNVLPELGEENMYQTTFQEYAAKFLPTMELEDMNDQMEFLLAHGGSAKSGCGHDGNSASGCVNVGVQSEGDQNESVQNESVQNESDQNESAQKEGTKNVSTKNVSTKNESTKNVSAQEVDTQSIQCELGDARRFANIRYKHSPEFVTVLKKYSQYLVEEDREFVDLVYRDVTVLSKEELADLYRRKYCYLPLSKRLEKIRQRVFYLWRPLKKARYPELVAELNPKLFPNKKELRAQARLNLIEEFKPLRETLDRMTAIDLYQIYGRLFTDEKLFRQLAGEELPERFAEIAAITLEQLERKHLYYEEVAPLLFLRGLVHGVPDTMSIKHVFIDEVQDYTPLHFAIFKQLFPHSKFTMLGDLNQSINAYVRVGQYENVLDVFAEENAALIQLSKSYRSTREITAFAREILLNGEEAECVDRGGVKPEIFLLSDRSATHQSILEGIANLRAAGCNSIAVITKTVQSAVTMHEELSKMPAQSTKQAHPSAHVQLDAQILSDSQTQSQINLPSGSAVISADNAQQFQIQLLTKDFDSFIRGVIVIPSYLAKGLEFDAVLIVTNEEENYCWEEERQLLYTVCTRALHRLQIYSAGPLSPFLAEVSPELYEKFPLSSLGK